MKLSSSSRAFFLEAFLGALFASIGCATPGAGPGAAPTASQTPPADSPAPSASASPVLPATAAPAPSVSSEIPATAEGGQTPSPRAPAGVGGMCGGIAGFGCQKALYCEFASEAHCGAADMSGTCRARPDVCTFEYAPVCGCDDKTYSNACAAAQAGVSVSHKGECASRSATPASLPAGALGEGKLCGTRGVAATCADGFYCAYRRQCGDDDSGGVCTKKAPICTKIYAPVCGCDGKTYGSACTASGAGVSVRANGACPGSP